MTRLPRGPLFGMSGFAVLVAVALVSPGPSTSFVCNYPGARLCGDGRHAVDFGDPRVIKYGNWKCVPRIRRRPRRRLLRPPRPRSRACPDDFTFGRGFVAPVRQLLYLKS